MQRLEQAFGAEGLSADDRFLKAYLLNEVLPVLMILPLVYHLSDAYFAHVAAEMF